MKVDETLDKAADILSDPDIMWVKEEGWPHRHDDTKLCLEGGIMAALGLTDVDIALEQLGVHLDLSRPPSPNVWHDPWTATCPAYQAVQRYLASNGMISSPSSPAYAYNDRDDTTRDDVIDVLRRAAKMAREEEQA